MAKKKVCRHKRLILASADLVDFIPDQEPFESGTIECAGVNRISIGCINIHYCPKCNVVRDIEIEPDAYIGTDECTPADRCNGH